MHPEMGRNAARFAWPGIGWDMFRAVALAVALMALACGSARAEPPAKAVAALNYVDHGLCMQGRFMNKEGEHQ